MLAMGMAILGNVWNHASLNHIFVKGMDFICALAFESPPIWQPGEMDP